MNEICAERSRKMRKVKHKCRCFCYGTSSFSSRNYCVKNNNKGFKNYNLHSLETIENEFLWKKSLMNENSSDLTFVPHEPAISDARNRKAKKFIYVKRNRERSFPERCNTWKGSLAFKEQKLHSFFSRQKALCLFIKINLVCAFSLKIFHSFNFHLFKKSLFSLISTFFFTFSTRKPS